MDTELYASLGWLPAPPDDFTAQCRGLLSQNGDLGKTVRALASSSLNLNQLIRLSRTIQELRKSGKSLSPLTPFTLGILSNSTSDFIVPSLVASAARHGVALTVVASNYGQVIQEALSPDSTVNQAGTDAVLIAIDYRGLPIRPTPGRADEAHATVQQALGFLNTIRTGIKTNCNAICIFQTLAAPPEANFGSLDRVLPGTVRNLIDG